MEIQIFRGSSREYRKEKMGSSEYEMVGYYIMAIASVSLIKKNYERKF